MVCERERDLFQSIRKETYIIQKSPAKKTRYCHVLYWRVKNRDPYQSIVECRISRFQKKRKKSLFGDLQKRFKKERRISINRRDVCESITKIEMRIRDPY